MTNHNAINNNQSIKLLAWDSQLFGFKIGQITTDDQQGVNWPVIFNESRKLNLACLYLLANAGNSSTIQQAEEAGFRFMDVRMTMHYGQFSLLGDIQQVEFDQFLIRTAAHPDLPTLQKIARTSHQNTRFYADPNFSRKDCDHLYEVWIENSLAGYAQQVFIAENLSSKEVVGYITCHLENEKGKIGLIAVDPTARRSQVGYGMIQKSLDWFIKNEASSVEVVTQGNSRPALNLYQKAGFQVSKLELWFHKWFYLPEPGESTSQ